MVQSTMRSIYISSENEWTQSLYEKVEKKESEENPSIDELKNDERK